MLMRILLLLFISLFTNYSIASEYTWDNGQTFGKAKLKLKTGEFLKVNKLTVDKPHVNIYKYSHRDQDWVLTNRIPLEQIEHVEVPAKTMLLDTTVVVGILGAGIAWVTLPRNEVTQMRIENIYSYSGKLVDEQITSSTDEELRWSPLAVAGYVSGIAATGMIVGALIGKEVVKEWKTIYSSHEENGQVSYRISLLSYTKLALAVQVIF